MKKEALLALCMLAACKPEPVMVEQQSKIIKDKIQAVELRLGYNWFKGEVQMVPKTVYYLVAKDEQRIEVSLDEYVKAVQEQEYSSRKWK